MISTLEMAEAIIKTYRHTDAVSRDVCSHCDQFEEAPLWVITHSPDCIVLKCEHLKKMAENPPAPVSWSLYAQYVGRGKRIMPEPLGVECEQLREYHANANKKLNSYADDSGLRESDVKRYRKRAAFHQTMVETIDKALGEPK